MIGKEMIGMPERDSKEPLTFLVMSPSITISHQK